MSVFQVTLDKESVINTRRIGVLTQVIRYLLKRGIAYTEA